MFFLLWMFIKCMIVPVSDILSPTPCISSYRSEPLLTPVVDLQPGLHQGQGDGPLHQGADLHETAYHPGRLMSWHLPVTQDLCLSNCSFSPLGTGFSALSLLSLQWSGQRLSLDSFLSLEKRRSYLILFYHFIASHIV